MENNNYIAHALPLMSPALDQLFTALAKAQGEMMTAGKGSYNTLYKSWFADWETIKEVSRDPLAKNGLSVSQSPIQIEKDYKVLYTILGHSSGQFIASTWHVNPKPIVTKEGKVIEVTVQMEGGHVTFIKRYAYAAIIGLSLGEDDDGNSGHSASVKHGQESNTTNDYANDGVITSEELKALLDLLNTLPNATVLENNIKKFNNITDLSQLKQSKYKGVIAYIDKQS